MWRIRASNIRTKYFTFAFREDGSISTPMYKSSPYTLTLFGMKRLTRWCIVVQEALCGGRAPPWFLVVEPFRQGEGPLALDSTAQWENILRGKEERQGEARTAVQPPGEEGEMQLRIRSAGVTLARLETALAAPTTMTSASDGESGRGETRRERRGPDAPSAGRGTGD